MQRVWQKTCSRSKHRIKERHAAGVPFFIAEKVNTSYRPFKKDAGREARNPGTAGVCNIR